MGRFECRILFSFLLIVSLVGGASADKLKVGKDFIPLTKDKPYIYVIHEGRSIRVQRVQDPDYQLKGYFARTARKCPPFCLQPISPAPGIRTIGEVEMFDFMETELRDGTGLLIDARTPAWHKKGTIPGSINIPFTHLTKTDEDPEVLDAFKLFGVRPREEPGLIDEWLEKLGWSDNPYVTEKWDFSKAKNLVLWCNGPECGQSPRAIRGLLKLGYPADKIRYYRGGMQIWQLWGLTTVVPGE
ncbi:MAG: rhodanese-like domain-containing protein [Gammaproteobacteria bacterium]|nr:MAG: rhodanese-like domain-containing protein [Gammaproteobacteria bacterium]